MIGFQVFEWALSFVEAMIGISVNATVFFKKINWKNSCIASSAVAMVIWGINQFQLFSFTATIAGIIGIAVGAHLVYQIKWTDTFVVSSAYLLLIYIVDFLTISMFAVLFQKEDSAYQITKEFSFFRMAASIVSKMLLFAVYWLMIRKALIKVEFRLWKAWLGVIVGSLCTYYLAVITFLQADRSILLIWSLVLFVVFLGVYSFFQYSAYVKKKDELKFLEERNKLLTDNIQNTIQSYRNNQIFYHDLKNHHLVIETYLENQEYEKATEYMKILRTMEQETTPKIWTGLETLDILIECKKKAAEEEGIFVTIISDQIHLKMEEQEMVALFGNLFDNAIESCRNVDEGKRWIRIIFRMINGMVFLKVSNSSGKVPSINGEELVSQKDNHNLHGWGIKSIKAIVEKYEGDMQIEFNREIFSVRISFFD